MLFEKFFRTISGIVPANLLFNMEALSELDPDKIYVENVRSIFRVPSGVAQAICDLAVRQGAFKRFVAVQCPDLSEGAEAPDEAQLPETVTCYSEEGGFIHEVELPTKSLPKITFYRLANG